MNITSVSRTLWAILDSHRGNVNNFGPHDPQIINITSVLRTFWEIIDSHRGNVNNFGPHDPQMLNSTRVLRTFWEIIDSPELNLPTCTRVSAPSPNPDIMFGV